MSQSQLKPSEACINAGDAVPINDPDFKGGGGSSEPDSENGSQGSCRIKKLALELLSALCGKRVDPTKIKFTETALRDPGGNGDVVEATLVGDNDDESQPERQVAVKELRLLEGDIEKFLKAFVAELRILNKLCHPHIAKIIGFAEDIENGIAWMIFPWEANGNIRKFLRSGAWEIPERVSLIRDVAAGLEYLHNRQPPICHGDLKSLNILVNDSYRALITDFGSARVMNGTGEGRLDRQPAPLATDHANFQGHQSRRINASLSDGQLTLTGPSWSLRWAAPEVLGGQDPGLASDIWAFGWVCWEIITDNLPFSDTNNKTQIIVMVVRGQLPSIDVHDQLSQIRSLCNIILKCWEPEPRERPSVIECQRLLGWIPFSIPVMKSPEESEIRSAALLMQIGEMYRVQDRNDAALNVFQKGLAIARSTGDKVITGGILLQLGHLSRVESRHTQADESYAEAVEIYKGAGDGLGQADALIGRGNIHLTWSNHDKAEGFYVDALGLCALESDGGGFLGANALIGLGRIHHTRSKYAEAERCYTQALAIGKDIGYILAQINALFGVGRIHMVRSEYAEAEQSFTQALSLSTSVGNRFNQASASLGLGDAYRARLKYSKAEESFSSALEIFRAAGNRFGQASALLGLGYVYHALSNSGKAEKFSSQALETYTSVGYTVGRGNAFCELGSIRRTQLKHAEAEGFYTQALEVYTGVGDSFGRAEAFLGLGDTSREQSKYDEAEKYYAEALEIHTSVGNRLGRANALRGLGDIHRERSGYEQAEELYEQALGISTSLEDELGQAGSSLGLGELRIRQARYVEAKALIERAAELSERLGYRFGKDQSEKLLLSVIEAENSTAERQSLHLIPAVTTTERPTI